MGVRYTLQVANEVKKGYADYVRTGLTTERSYLLMRELYRMTGGWSHDFLTGQIRRKSSPYPLPKDPNGILGQITPAILAPILAKLRTDGFVVFDQHLPEATLTAITDFALTASCRNRPMRPELPETTVYDRKSPKSELYQFEERTLIDEPVFQTLLADPSTLAVAQAYLGAPPTISSIESWWSTAYSKVASNQAAQLYHFDLDWGSRWLKFFIYVNQVGPDNGPHCYVRGSHLRSPRTKKLLNLGDRRLTDEEVRAVFPPEDIVEITGPSGTTVAVDTRGFHKGKPIASGDRLIVQLEYASSLFGNDPHRKPLGDTIVEPLKAMCKTYPALYKKYS